MTLLEVENLTKHFGGLTAVNHLSFSVQSGEIIGLIGPNGAGKTTVFNLISGVLQPGKGSIRFKGEELCSLKPHKIARKGIVRTFQLTNLF
ncbi:MAG: ABC transporter ATP-binding protein, partial [Deltaproteobacteria bacterium CG_4_9_14_3_um_filter_44_9]